VKTEEGNVNKVFRISQKMGPYTLAGIKGAIKPLDPVQMCTLDAVFDPICPLTIIDGVLGTGKTMLTLMASLATVQGEKRSMFYDQILVTISPESVNKSLYTGFKPGETHNKLAGHLGGFKSNLKFLLDPERKKENRKNKLKDGEEPEALPSDESWEKNFNIIEIDEMQGTSLHNTILLVDEYQKLSADALKLILSRISENSKVVLIGDSVGQVYGLNRGAEGFKTLYKHLGKSPQMNYIKMENIYRSKLAAFVEELFD
jgi:PhoH-like ATPase